MGFAEAASQVSRMGILTFGQVLDEHRFQSTRQSYHTVFITLAIVDRDGALAEVDVLDPQPKRLHQPQAAAVHELGWNQTPIYMRQISLTDPVAVCFSCARFMRRALARAASPRPVRAAA